MMDSYISNRYKNIGESLLTQSSDPNLLYPDLVNFSIGDPDIHTDEIIVKKAFDDALKGHVHYTENLGRLKLREAIANYYYERFKYKTSSDNIMVTTSGLHAMYLAMEATLNEGDEVIIPTPHFSLYTDQVKLARGIPVYVETFEEEGFQLNIERLESKITGKTRAILLNTPNNPTGTCLSRKNLEDIAEVAKKYDLIVYADDVYTIYSYEEEFMPITALKDMGKRTISIGSFSKDYCMTGWRIGYLMGNPELIKVAGNINDALIYSAPSISQQAALYALEHRHEIQPKLVEQFKERVYYAYERLKKLNNVSVMEPRGTFYLFPSIKGTGLSSMEVARILLEEAHVLVIPGNAFGQAGEGHIRLACTIELDKMKEGFDRMEKLEIFR
ncbi:aminotransferase class I/II-fold pyridoxal phosphate-dependent enzyme [Tissierella creatinini]|nr:aminotransferase class I/II-fold pyridoxal phosphate-dependent enzyme [Tissierella creatinini]TJX64346.1 aminotransferase class I/II-fold pyridoxal phosphate-dependent enzyme [Soehngenia saccharolytica]